jgi:hypothetical protein
VLPALAGIGLPLLEHASTDDSFAVTGRIVLGVRMKTQIKKKHKYEAWQQQPRVPQFLSIALLQPSGFNLCSA